MLYFANKCLKKSGKLIFQEYTGDCYLLLNDKKKDILNRILNSFHDSLLETKIPYKNPSFNDINKFDPSEGVRSVLILPLLKLFFNIDFLKPLPGTFLQKLYPRLKNDKMNQDSPEIKTILNLL